MGFPQPDTGAVTEDAGIVGGFLTATDDINFGPFFNNDAGQWTAETISGAYGSTLVIDDDGVWTYSANNANASIQALNTGETLTEVFTATSTNGTSTITITINGTDEPPCFVAGTLIDTPNGPRPIEDLRAGDQVITRDNGIQRISWAGSRDIQLGIGSKFDALQPIRVSKGSLGPGLPDRDLWFSPMHRLLIKDPTVSLITGSNEVFCAAKHLVNGQTIVKETRSNVCYHHLMFEEHQVLVSSGCDSESFYPGAIGLDGFEDETREEVLGLFPELRTLPDNYGRLARQVVKKYEANLIRERFTPAQVFWNNLINRAA